MCSPTGEYCSKWQTLFDKIDSTLISDELDWDNVVAVDLNNTSTNLGDKNSLKFRILAKNN